MKIYMNNINRIGFESRHQSEDDRSWVMFEWVDGRVAVDKFGEPLMSDADFKRLNEWMRSTAKKRAGRRGRSGK